MGVHDVVADVGSEPDPLAKQAERHREKARELQRDRGRYNGSLTGRRGMPPYLKPERMNIEVDEDVADKLSVLSSLVTVIGWV